MLDPGKGNAGKRGEEEPVQFSIPNAEKGGERERCILLFSISSEARGGT